jgi:GntR family transcriptional regulator
MAQSRDRPLDFGLDRTSDVPLGTQLAWKLRGAIAAQRLRAGDRLPAVRELAAAAGVNVNTVRAVYARLADQGVIVSEHGRGTFVADAAGDGQDLRELAERTAHDAATRGVDPRELAAVLYARTPSAGDTPPAGETDRRREARGRIARLERELAELDQELALLDERPAPTPAPLPAPQRQRGGARILASGELEAIHETLAMQVADRRVRLGLARDRGRSRDRGDAPRSRSVASAPPQLVVGSGTWTLRWRV